MAEHPIHNLMKVSMENIKQMVDVDTIVGNPVKTDNGETIIPVSKVSFGFAAGGSEFEFEHKTSTGDHIPFGGGSGGGFSITPIAFLVVNQSGVELKHLEERTSLYERLLDQAPKVVNSIMNEFDKSGIKPSQETNEKNE